MVRHCRRADRRSVFSRLATKVHRCLCPQSERVLGKVRATDSRPVVGKQRPEWLHCEYSANDFVGRTRSGHGTHRVLPSAARGWLSLLWIRPRPGEVQTRLADGQIRRNSQLAEQRPLSVVKSTFQCLLCDVRERLLLAELRRCRPDSRANNVLRRYRQSNPMEQRARPSLQMSGFAPARAGRYSVSFRGRRALGRVESPAIGPQDELYSPETDFITPDQC